MRLIIAAITTCFIVAGCKAPGLVREFPSIDDYEFERTVDRPDASAAGRGKTISVRFDGVPMPMAMSILSQESGTPIVWGQALDAQTVYGSFLNVPLATALDTLARRCGASVAEVGGVYYLGEVQRSDRVFAVAKMVPVDRTQLLDALKSSSSVDGSISIVGSCILVCDTIESVRKILAALETIRERSERSYMCEVYFIRCQESDFLKLTADLQIRQIDVFASTFNVEQLFSMFVDAQGGFGKTKIDQRPVLRLAEGRKATFSNGKDIVREQRTVSPEGTSQVSGYQTFSDGLNLELCLNRVSDNNYMVDVSLVMSVFDSTDKNSVPSCDKSSLVSQGLLLRDGKIAYAGSLRRKDRHDRGGLFSIDSGQSSDFLTIWVRVRELKP